MVEGRSKLKKHMCNGVRVRRVLTSSSDEYEYEPDEDESDEDESDEEVNDYEYDSGSDGWHDDW
ncbi:hypothetical protein CCACVL1_19308 [Corchorus capsularis]|uniref:Uncharacterized protein n=1 Tax=Corchorus capsularis TaxID=210143 RepID=A0A1R3HHF4_COCAP|nr:hypothetical protein CCACVL1_19308 [Corchorus capsularis]